MDRYVVEETFWYLGYECKIVFQELGHRCGYIKIPKDHPFYDQDYDFCNQFVDCHGGLTYAAKYICGEDCDDGEWLGFDCSHCDDKPDIEASKKYFPGAHSNDWYEAVERLNDCYVVRTKEFCKEGLMRLALQFETARNIIEYFHVDVKEDK